MRREVILAEGPLDGAPSPPPASGRSGAVVRFLGVVRADEQGRAIEAIEYEVHRPMALRQFHRILDEAGGRWPLESVRVAHSAGRVAVGEASLSLEVAAPHRQEAFAATAWIIDQMKRRVPVWKHPR